MIVRRSVSTNRILPHNTEMTSRAHALYQLKLKVGILRTIQRIILTKYQERETLVEEISREMEAGAANEMEAGTVNEMDAEAVNEMEEEAANEMDAETVNEIMKVGSFTEEDAQCITSFTFTRKNFSQLDTDLSPPCMIQNLPWKILIMKRHHEDDRNLHRRLGFFITCNKASKSCSWSCNTSVCLTIISQREGVNNYGQKFQHLFHSAENDWGFSYFISWNDIMNPNRGFIKNDTVIFHAAVSAYPLRGIISDHQTCTCHVDLKNDMPIWDRPLLSTNLLPQCKMNITLWAPLSDINQSVLDKVRLAYVFGHCGNEALIITEDDAAWAYTLGDSSCFFLRNSSLHNDTVCSIRRVDALNRQGVKEVSFGLNQKKLKVHSDDHLTAFMVVCTSSGNVIQLGRPKGGKDDLGCDSDIIPISELWCLPKISQVACGSRHCLALSTAGQLFSWGSNEYGQIGNGNASVDYYDAPHEIEKALKNKSVVKVSCGFSFSVALSDDGQVYIWGRDVYERENNKCQHLPILVPFNGVKIKEIVCGFSHVLAISIFGELFAWGMNNRGQLGFGDNRFRSDPQQIETIVNVVDIAASYLSNTSAAKTANGEVFMWGECSGCVVWEPLKTPHKSLMEVFAYYGTPKITYKPIVHQIQAESVSDTMRKAFDNKENSDLTIKADGKEIFVHKSILRLRSDYFRVLLQEQWTKEDQKILEVSQAYDVIHSYLRYLYTGNFEADMELVLELLVLAEEYQDLPAKELCEEKLLLGINIDNVGILYPWASILNTERLKESCLLFASSRLSEVLETAAFSSWDADAVTQFKLQCQMREMFKF